MDFILGFGAVIAVGLIYHYREPIKKSIKVTVSEVTGRDWD